MSTEVRVKSVSKEAVRANSDHNQFNGLEEHTVYWDPLGGRVGKPINLKQDFYEQDRDILEKWDELMNKGYSVNGATREIRKNLDTGDWNLPTFYQPEVNVVQPELTPLADLLPRETIQNETVNVTVETEQPGVAAPLETTDDSEGSYTYADGTYSDYTFDVVGYGLASRLEDKLIMSAQSLRSTESVAETAHMNAMRQFEEAQIIHGTNNDADAFDGIDDMGTEYKTLDTTSSQDYAKEVRELIDEVEFQGGNRGDIAIVTDFATHRRIREDMQDFTRYQIGDRDELGFGFSTMELDGVPIMKSHAITKNDGSLQSGDGFIYGLDAGSHYMGMLQDTTVKPLAKVAPQEQFATDAYGTFVSEAKDHLQYIAKS